MILNLKINVKSVNKDKYSHWGKRSGLVKHQREVAATAIANKLCMGALTYAPYNIVSLTRYNRKLDSDNLVGAFKAIRDGICDALGVNDGSENIKWVHSQKTDKKNYITIEIDQYDNIKQCEMDFAAKKVAARSLCVI